MKTTRILTLSLGCALLCLPAQLRAQDDSRPSTKQLIEQLGAEEHDVRKAAEKRLLESGKKSLDILRKVAKTHGDPEVRWRVSRILRRIEEGKRGPGLRRREPGKGDIDAPRPRRRQRRGFPFSELDERLEGLLRRLENEVGGSHLDGDFLKDLKQQMEKIRKMVRTRDGGFGFGFDTDLDFKSGFKSKSKSKSLQMSVGPDGVRVEVKSKGEDGKTKTKVYEAPDMETFKRKYPDVAEKHGLWRSRSEIRFGEGGFPRLFGERPWIRVPMRKGFDFEFDVDVEVDRDVDRDTEIEVEMPKRGERLGIYVGELDRAVRNYLGLEEGQGLLVDRVVDGSLAEELGVKKGDIVLKIGDAKIGSAADVQKALRRTAAGKTVTVKVNRRGRDRLLEAEKMHGAKPKPLRRRYQLR